MYYEDKYKFLYIMLPILINITDLSPIIQIRKITWHWDEQTNYILQIIATELLL